MSTQHTLIGAYVLNAVDEAERETMQSHLSECPECDQEAREMEETVSRLADITITEPPRRLRDNVLNEMRQTRQDAPPKNSPQEILKPRRIVNWRQKALVATLSVFMLLIGGLASWVFAQQQFDSERQEADQMAAVLAAGDADASHGDAEGGGRVSVVYSPEHDQAVVSLSELTSVEEDRAYQLWLVEGEEPVSAGVIEAGTDTATMLVDNVGDADIVAVTNEPAEGSEQPTTPILAGVELSTSS